jgi:hypothetical protein
MRQKMYSVLANLLWALPFLQNFYSEALSSAYPLRRRQREDIQGKSYPSAKRDPDLHNVCHSNYLGLLGDLVFYLHVETFGGLLC